MHARAMAIDSARCAPVAPSLREEEAAVIERHPVGGNERARAVDQDGRVVRSLRLQTDAQLAEVVALDEPERLQRLRRR